ncbi:hypothetical protein D030_1073 [Vibrio parahaemolyticus AQ3810]|nr:hypothetical protein D030_1073 [Vibrio parahaemolyticus AQ3810]
MNEITNVYFVLPVTCNKTFPSFSKLLCHDIPTFLVEKNYVLLRR